MRPVSTLVLSGLLIVLSACGGGGSGSKCETCNASVAPPVSRISGQILDKAGAPVPGVTVSVYYHNVHTTQTTTTDSNGAYVFAGLDANSNAMYTADYELYAEKSGWGFYPVVSDPAAKITRFDFNGLWRTLIRFVPPPSPGASGNNFTAYRAGDRVASLPRSGQSVSFSSGDDAAAGKGVAWPGSRFTDNLNGTVTDHLTGLIWLKNAQCQSAAHWDVALASANQLASGACGLTDGSTAGQWRMPNINELESLVDVSQTNPAVQSGAPFTNIGLTSAYWSSTTYTALPSNAMAIRFTDGRWINGIAGTVLSFDNSKANTNNFLWAVKSGTQGAVQVLATGVYAAGSGKYANNGGTFAMAGDDATLQLGAPLTSPRFIDKADGTLVDTVTGLTWLKRANCISGTWPSALAAVNSLASGQCGLTDGSTAGQWRMPNRNEMLSLSDRAPTFPQAEYFTGQAQGGTGPVTGPQIFSSFIAFKFYWTSTTNAADTSQAWTIFSCDFGVYNVGKTDDQQYSLAVR
ncbi:MAG: DUF1566 domain-containing protein [Pseudomonadota bacterium]